MTVQLSSLRVTADMDVASYVRGSAQKQAADKGMVASSQEVGRALAAQDAAADKSSARIQSVSRQWVDGYASAARFEKAVRDIGRAMDTGMDAGRATAALDGVYRKFGMVADAAALAKQGFVSIAPVVDALNRQMDAMGESAKRAAAVHAQVAQARAMQTDIAGRLGMDRQPYDARGSAAAFEADAAKRVSTLTQRLLPMEAELERYKKALREVADLEASGAISRQRALDFRAAESAVHEQSKKSIEGMFVHQSKYGNVGGLARHEAINLSRQIQDVVVSLQGGQAPLTVLLQQGTQIADIFAASNASFSGFAKQVMSYVTPMRVAVGGLTAAVIAGAAAWHSYAEGQRAVALSLEGIGRGSGMTVAGINAIAESVARVDRMSVSQARGIASTIAGTGKIDRGLVAGITDASYGYGILTGQGSADAGKALATAFADPVKGAEQLNERLGFLNGALSDYIRNAMASGDRAGAQRALFEAMNPAIQRAAENVGFLTKAWGTLGSVISNVGDTMGRALSGPSLASQLADVERQIAKIEAQRKGVWGGVANTDGRLNTLQTDRDRLRVEIEYERRKAESARREQDANALGLQGNSVIRSIVDDIARLEGMRGNKSLLERLLGDPEALAKSGMSAEQARTALDRMNVGLVTFQTAAQKAAQDGQMQVQQIMAYTLAERAAAEAQIAYVNALRSTQNAALAAVEAENARNRVIAEANRQARDALRDANLDAKLIGLSPFQRGLQQIRNEREKDMQQNAGSVGAYNAPPTAFGLYGPQMAAVGGVDPTFKGKVAALIEALGDSGARMTSGYRSFEKQTELYNLYGPGKAARPGTSQHEHGTAMDYVFSSPELRVRAMEMARAYGLRALSSNGGAVHFDLGPSGRGPANDNRQAVSLDSSTRSAAWSRKEQNYIADQQIGPIVHANLALDAQERILSKMRQTIGATPAETARLNAEMDIMRTLAQAGVRDFRAVEGAIAKLGVRAAQVSEQGRLTDFMRKQMDELKSLERDTLGGFFTDTVNGLRRGESLWKSFGNAGVNALNRIADAAIKMALDQAFFNQPGGGFFGSLLKGMFGGGGGSSIFMAGSPTGGLYANGAAFGGGNVIPFARGDVFDRPITFPMAGGRTGLLGEAGAEGILPLRRGADGKLGVTMYGAPSTGITYAPTFTVMGDVSQETIDSLRHEMRASEARVARMTASAVRAETSPAAFQKKTSRVA